MPTPDHRYPTCTILSGQSQSESVNVNGTTPLGILAPASWTAASLTLLASLDGTNFYPVFDTAGVEVTITVTAGAYIPIPALALNGFDFIKLRSGTNATPVNQGADRAFTLVCKRYV